MKKIKLPAPIDPEVEATVNSAFEPAVAKKVLMNFLLRPHCRANGKSTMSMYFDLAVCRAIIALEKESKENPGDTETTRSIADRTVYTDYKHEAWVAALNILATEYYVKTNQPDKYSYYCDILNSLDDTQLECLHIWLSLNTHITSLGHMMSHNDYEHVKENLFDFLEEAKHDND